MQTAWVTVLFLHLCVLYLTQRLISHWHCVEENQASNVGFCCPHQCGFSVFHVPPEAQRRSLFHSDQTLLWDLEHFPARVQKSNNVYESRKGCVSKVSTATQDLQ